MVLSLFLMVYNSMPQAAAFSDISRMPASKFCGSCNYDLPFISQMLTIVNKPIHSLPAELTPAESFSDCNAAGCRDL